MMKKLLALVLVLGLASWASADLTGVQLSVGGNTDGAGNVTNVELPICTELIIDVHGPTGYDWAGYIIIEGAFPGAGGEWGDKFSPTLPLCSGYYYENQAYPVKTANAGDMASVLRYTEEGWGFGYELISAQGVGNVPGGEEFQFIYHCCGPESEYVTISLFDNTQGFDDAQDTIVIHQIPEPATMALLGLGGLLLRRKK